MSDAILESDWKIFRQLRPIALDRFCERILLEINRLASDANKTHHERYLAIFQLIRRRDEEVADAFNDFRRSTAVRQLARIQMHDLFTEEEMGRFSAETRSTAQFLVETWRS
jgi:hypothetical protein